MDPAAANDCMPKGPLLLACTNLLLAALPCPTCQNLLGTTPASPGTPEKGVHKDPAPPQRDGFVPQPALLPRWKAMGKGRERESQQIT